MPVTYYTTDFKRLSISELWRCADNGAEFVVGLIVKLLRIPVTPNFGIARFDRLACVAAGAVPAAVRDRVAPTLDEAQRLGMTPAFCYTLPTVGSLQGYGWVLYGPESGLIMTIDYASMDVGSTVKDKVGFGFVSSLNDGRCLVTQLRTEELDPPPDCDLLCLPRTSMAEILDEHRHRISRATAGVVPLRDEETLREFVLRREQGVLDHHISRGVFVPLTDGQVALLRDAPRPELKASDSSSASARSTSWLEWLCWFSLAFGVFLYFRGQANQAQLTFRMSLIGVGLAGVILFQILRLIRRP